MCTSTPAGLYLALTDVQPGLMKALMPHEATLADGVRSQSVNAPIAVHSVQLPRRSWQFSANCP